MADLESRVEKVEEKIRELELSINKSLSDIKVSLTEIKTSLQSNTSSEDLKNDMIKKDVENLEKRTKQLEDNQSKIIWTVVLGVLALVGRTVVYFIQNMP